MHAWEQIQLTVDYIEEHLSEELAIEDLARIAGLSPFYFQRLFGRLVKKPVMEYIKLRRMALATEALLQNELRILDIALDLGFPSHVQFTRTFKETFGMTPGEYRNRPVTLNRMTRPQIQLQYTLVDENVPLISHGMVLEIRRAQQHEEEDFIGLRAKMPVSFVDGLGIESGTDPLDTLWRRFHQQKEGTPHLISGGDELGVAYPCQEDGYFYYFAGAQADSGVPPEGMEGWKIPAGEYIVCSFEAENFESLVMDVLYKAQQYLFSTWLPNHGLSTEPFSLERYATHGMGTNKMEIWVKPISISDSK